MQRQLLAASLLGILLLSPAEYAYSANPLLQKLIPEKRWTRIPSLILR